MTHPTRALVALAGVCLLVAFLCGGRAAAPPADRARSHEAAVQRLLERYRAAAVRVNGARLRLAAQRSGGEILVHWKVDYTGPRQPLNVLRPSLTDHAAYGQTALLFIALGPDGREYSATFKPPFLAIPGPQPRASRESYLTVRGGKVGEGTLRVWAGDVWAKLRARWPGKFGELPERVYAQLRHSPADRGEHLGLDAWTGELQTELVPVSLQGAMPLPRFFP